MPEELKLGEFLCGILPRLASDKTLPAWPPDCFALCFSVLKRTGVYTRLFSNWPPGAHIEDALEKWVEETQQLGKYWRESWNSGEAFTLVDDAWQSLCESFDLPLNKAIQRDDVSIALVRLASAADEASESVGAPLDEDENEPSDLFLYMALD